MWQKVWAYIKYVAKVVWGVGLPIAYEAAVELVDALQGSFIDQPYITFVLGAIGIFLAKNGPKPT